MGEEYVRRIMVLGEVPSLGPVLLHDDMEDLLKWVEAGTGGDTVFEKIATVAYNGSASLHMKTRTTGATEGDETTGYRDTFRRPGKRYRLECLFRPDASAQSGYVLFSVAVFDGTTQHNPYIRWDEVNAKWQYRDGADSWADISDGDQNMVEDQFHRFLMEWDENSGKFIRFSCDGLEVDMSAISYYAPASAAEEVLRVDLGLMAGATPPGEVYFDECLIMEI